MMMSIIKTALTCILHTSFLLTTSSSSPTPAPSFTSLLLANSLLDPNLNTPETLFPSNTRRTATTTTTSNSTATFPFDSSHYSFTYVDCLWKRSPTLSSTTGSMIYPRNQYVYFKLCPTKSCGISDYKCGSYMIDVTLYLTLYNQYEKTKQVKQCETCESHCGVFVEGNETYYDDDDHPDNYRRVLWDESDASLDAYCKTCHSKCYTSTSQSSSSSYSVAVVKPENFFTCSAVSYEDAMKWRSKKEANGNYVDDSYTQYYIGPYCDPYSSTASHIKIGIFSDSFCITHLPGMSLSSITGQYIQTSKITHMVSHTCVPCTDRQYDSYTNKVQTHYHDSICNVMYRPNQTSKCESNFDSNANAYATKDIKNSVCLAQKNVLLKIEHLLFSSTKELSTEEKMVFGLGEAQIVIINLFAPVVGILGFWIVVLKRKGDAGGVVNGGKKGLLG